MEISLVEEGGKKGDADGGTIGTCDSVSPDPLHTVDLKWLPAYR